ncbi:MAG: hypothetical protein R2727_08180 [Bacteroidales bacterium]
MKGVERGSASSSKVYEVLTAIWSEEMMPPGQPLSLENRTIIQGLDRPGCKLYCMPGSLQDPEATRSICQPESLFRQGYLPGDSQGVVPWPAVRCNNSRGELTSPLL